MAKSNEREYLIPVADTGTNWQQTCEIPVIHTTKEIYSQIFNYLEFRPLAIRAGGWPNEPMETVQQRIRVQMIGRLENIGGVNADLILQQLRKYFTPRNDSNVQLGR